MTKSCLPSFFMFLLFDVKIPGYISVPSRNDEGDARFFLNFRHISLEVPKKSKHVDHFLRQAVKSGKVAMNLNLGAPGDEEVTWTFGTFNRDAIEQDLAPNRNAFSPNIVANLWKNDKEEGPVVPYRIKDTPVTQSQIETALRHIEDKTCIRFREASWFPLGHRVFFGDGSTCSSVVGRKNAFVFGQKITLGNGCSAQNIIVHEVCHALGLYHTQSRGDRDEHITIQYSNVIGLTSYNFNKKETNNYGVPYDLYSVMHYGPLAFSQNGNSTILTLDPLAQGLMMYPRTGLSFADALILNRLYGCTERWLKNCGLRENPCHNLGFLRANCSCECPPGTTGSQCSTKEKEYQEALIEQFLPLTATVTTEQIISSPGYPTPQNEVQMFTKVIEAPACNRIVLTVLGFDLFRRQSDDRCSVEGLEIRLFDPVTSGSWHCGTELSAGTQFKSGSNKTVLFYMKSAMTINTNMGFSLNATFEDIPGCTP